MFSGSALLAGPKHSNSVPFRAGNPVPLSVDEKKELFDPNPVPDITLPGPQIREERSLCIRIHSSLPFTLQMVNPSMFPVTVHLKVKVSPEQVGKAAIICPVTSPVEKVNMYSSIHNEHIASSKLGSIACKLIVGV